MKPYRRVFVEEFGNFKAHNPAQTKLALAPIRTQGLAGPVDDAVNYEVGAVLAGQHDDLEEYRGEQGHCHVLVEHFASSLNEDQRQKFRAVQVVRKGEADQVSVLPDDRYINMALLYLYRKGTRELKHFMKDKKIEKIAIERDGILLSTGRLLDEMNFKETSEIPNLNLGSLGIKVNLPLVERFSPLAYSLGDYIHWNLARHKGVESCNRISLEHVSIVQGATLYKELGESCMVCRKKRKKYLEAAMGPISDSQLNLPLPAGWFR